MLHHSVSKEGDPSGSKFCQTGLIPGISLEMVDMMIALLRLVLLIGTAFWVTKQYGPLISFCCCCFYVHL